MNNRETFLFPLLTDSYKLHHYKQYQPGVTAVYSYFESRNGAMFPYTVFYGLQAKLKKYFTGVVITEDDITRSKKICDLHRGPGVFNEAGWYHILHKHGGKLPIKIMAVPEGLPIPISNVLMTVENTDEKCTWLTGHIETIITHIWNTCNIATISRHVKSIIKNFMDKTSDNPDAINYMLHCFGFRGASSVESAGDGGSAHLINFHGTDTVRAIETAMMYYNADVCAFSVPATEHSVMTSLGANGEEEIINQLLVKYPTGILSVVSDSYDIFHNVDEYVCKRFKDRILNRNGVYVVRPDSGDPVNNVLYILNSLYTAFGGVHNSKGYVVLDPHVRVLWGDGLKISTICDILHAVTESGFSAENLVFGMGGGLMQNHNRDTQRNAFKCSAQLSDGKWVDIYKNPKDTSKASKKGRLALVYENNEYKTIPESELNGRKNILELVFENGELIRDMTFDQVRNNAKL